MSLKRISSYAEKQICAAVHIHNFKQAIEELVYNSFDAESTSIAIRIFVQDSTIQVIDNGMGISHNDFQFLGHRYMTSKFKNTLQDQPVPKYGYKGLSLASIIDISEILKITSRCIGTENTFTKIFVEGKEQEIIKTSTRPSKGTTIEIKGFLYNLHIQKKTIDPNTEIALIKSFLEQVSPAHLNTSMSLRDDSKNEIIFQINKNRDIYRTLSSLFEISMNGVQELKVEKHDYKIHGFIEKYNDNVKKYNFVYVNGRFITKCIVHDNINKMLNKYSKSNITTKTNKENFKHEKFSNKNIPYYFVFIKCPYNDYDINQTTKNTTIEFRNEERINRLIKKFIDFYTGDLKLNPTNKTNKKGIEVNKIDTRKQVEIIMQKFLGSSLKRRGSQIRIGVKGKNVKRKQKNKEQNISISKIVSKKLNSKVDKLNNTNKSNINHHTLEQDLENCNSEININTSKQYTEISNMNIENFNNKQNNKTQQKTRKTDDIRISQDPINIIFKNPPDTVRRRYKMLWEQVKHLINNNGVEPIEDTKVFHNSHNNNNTNRNHVTYITNDAAQQKQNNYKSNKITSTRNDINDIKTSHDLIKSIFKGPDLFEFKTTIKRSIKEQFRSEDRLKTPRGHHVTTKHKLSYESHNYKEYNNLVKKKKFISTNSCNNFVTYKNQPKSYYETKKKYNNTREEKYSARQKCIAQKCNAAYFPNKNQCQPTLYTIESTKTNIFSKEQNMTEISHYTSNLSYGLVNQTYSSNIRESCYTDKFISSIEQTNYITYDLHKTYTIHTHTDKINQVKEAKSLNNVVDDKDPENKANINFKSDPNSKHVSSSEVDPLNVCETVYQSSNIDNNIERQSFNVLSKNNNDSLFEYEYNKHQPRNGDYTEKFSRYCDEQHILTLNTSKSINNIKEINEENRTSEETKTTEQVSERDIRLLLSGEKLIEVDLDTKNDEYFQLDSRYSFVPKGMSQITKVKFAKTKETNVDEEYYEDLIYYNFAKNVEIYSEIFEPNVLNIKDVKTKELRSVTLRPGENNVRLIFNARSLREATVLRQVDNKFVAAKLDEKCNKTSVTSEFLVLFDQHAVDERIRLENNLSDYFDGKKWISVGIEALPVKVPKEVTTYLHNYKDKFARFGLDWTFQENHVFIKAIPKAIVGKHSRQIEVITKAVKCLIFEQIEAIKSLKGNVVLYPKSIMDLVMNEACRYAIKFGDVLTNGECASMLTALSECKLPFQCAHGRPVMAVMMELQAQKNNYKINIDKVKEFQYKH